MKTIKLKDWLAARKHKNSLLPFCRNYKKHKLFSANYAAILIPRGTKVEVKYETN